MRWTYIPMLALPLLAACEQNVPEIGRDLPSNYADGNDVFNQRVKARFPAGADENQVIKVLQGQGFKLRPAYDGVRHATFIRDEVITKTIWSVRWRAKDEKISEVWGVYGVQAP